MKILITGGAGFIGTNLAKKLLGHGHAITVVDNYTTGTVDNQIPGVSYHTWDITDTHDYERLGVFDAVYHLAAIARIQPSFTDPSNYFAVNAAATFPLAQYCSHTKTPLIYAGSSSHHSGKFKNPYTFSKAIGEDILKLHEQHFGLKVTIARFYNVYGPHHLKSGGYCTLIGAWENRIENDLPLVIYGDGSKRRDFTHVDDIVEGLINILYKNVWGHILELGRGENYSILQIARMFNREITYGEDKPGEAQETLCDTTLAQQLIDWRPKKNIKDYIQNYLHA